MNKQIEEMARDLCEYYNRDGTCYQDDKTCDFKCECYTDAQNLYEKGYRKQSEGEWISVDERLPNNHRPVLVVCESTTISAGALIAIGSFGGGLWSLGGADGTLYLTKYMQFVVTHWMPLPEPPKMKGGE